MSLNKRPTLLTQDGKEIISYLQSIKCITNKLTLAQMPVTNDDLVIIILNGLGQEFRKSFTTIRARKMHISYEELYNKLIKFEVILPEHETSIIPATQDNMERRWKSMQQRGNNQNW